MRTHLHLHFTCRCSLTYTYTSPTRCSLTYTYTHLHSLRLTPLAPTRCSLIHSLTHLHLHSLTLTYTMLTHLHCHFTCTMLTHLHCHFTYTMLTHLHDAHSLTLPLHLHDDHGDHRPTSGGCTLRPLSGCARAPPSPRSGRGAAGCFIATKRGTPYAALPPPGQHVAKIVPMPERPSPKRGRNLQTIKHLQTKRIKQTIRRVGRLRRQNMWRSTRTSCVSRSSYAAEIG
jgi:hypothetical protein